MLYVLTGLTNDKGTRVFAFEGVGTDRARTAFTVTADLAAMRRHRIPMQEWPLLCRSVLEQRDETGAQRAFVYAETDMASYAAACAAKSAAARMRKAPRRPPSENLGAAWRHPTG